MPALRRLRHNSARRSGREAGFGSLDNKIHEPGAVLINPLFTTMVKVPTRTMNLEVELNLPSKEGLNVNAVISILYNIKRNRSEK